MPVNAPMTTGDWVVIAGYFLAVFGIALWASRGATRESSAGYFLAGRNVGWFVIGASLFASNIGSEHLVGLAGAGAKGGLAVAHFEILASLILLILGWVFVPFYLRSGVYTMPEFLERRYSAGARWYLATISVLGYVITKISVTIFAGALVFETVMGIDFWTGALITVLATGVYTIFGGLRAVLYTDLLQMFVLIGGAVAVTLIGLSHLGGWGAMVETAGPEFMNMWKPASHPDFPWTGVLFGAPILGVWYWCTDQFIVQRVLSAAGVDQARRGTLFGGYLKVLPLFLFVIPGVIAYGLARKGTLTFADPDQALPAMIAQLLPVGLRGLVVAGLLAALMSSLSSVFNSCSTLVTWDLYRKLRPGASERQLVWVGQISTVVLVALGIAWIPMMKLVSEAGIFVYVQKVQAYVSPPIAAVFLLGLFSKRLNSKGASAALLAGFLLGMARLVTEMLKSESLFATMTFLHFAIALFVVCAAVLIVVSLLTPAPDEARLAGLTYATTEGALESDPGWRRTDGILSFVLVLVVLAVWVVFS